MFTAQFTQKHAVEVVAPVTGQLKTHLQKIGHDGKDLIMALKCSELVSSKMTFKADFGSTKRAIEAIKIRENFLVICAYGTGN